MKTYLIIVAMLATLVTTYGWFVPMLLSTANTFLVVTGVAFAVLIPAVLVAIISSWLKSDEGKQIIKMIKEKDIS